MPQNDPFRSHQRGTSSPALDAYAITPDDEADLPTVARGIYVGGGGNLALVTLAGTSVVFEGLGAGSVLPCSATRVLATGTTAGALVALV